MFAAGSTPIDDIQVGGRLDPYLREGRPESTAFESIGLDVYLSAVESVRRFVVSRLRAAGRLDAVDSVMQDVRVAAWKTAGRFDPDRGTFGAFVQGIARTIVLRVTSGDGRYRRADHVTLDEVQDALPSEEPDPLATLVGVEARRRWLELVADHIDEMNWAVAVSIARDGTSAAEVARQFAISERAVRSIRERVALTGETIRRAMQAADEGEPSTAEIARSCIPDQGRLRAVARFLPDRARDLAPIAEATGLSASQLRHQIPTARRLFSIAQTILAAGESD